MAETGLVVKRVRWADVLEPMQKINAFGDDEESLKADVKNGLAFCWQVGNSFVITRLELDEMVVCCMASPDAESLKKAAMVLREAAKNNGCRSIRFHTPRAGIGRMLKELDVHHVGYVFKAVL